MYHCAAKTFCWFLQKIYETRSVPEQWKIAKTMPVFKKKGDCKNIQNFEKLILERISEIQDEFD
jgi:hypothetical protein